jgi:hypothetical protein
MRHLATAASGTFAAAILIFGLGATALADDSRTVYVNQGSLTGHACVATEWHFIINQLSGASQAPKSITVVWGSGATSTIGLTNFLNSTAHYTTTANIGGSVSNAYTTIVGAWSGQFVLSHGPCATTAAAVTTVTGTTQTTTAVTTQAATTGQTATTGTTTTQQSTSTTSTTSTATAQAPVAVGGVQVFTLSMVSFLPNTSTK